MVSWSVFTYFKVIPLRYTLYPSLMIDVLTVTWQLTCLSIKVSWCDTTIPQWHLLGFTSLYLLFPLTYSLRLPASGYCTSDPVTICILQLQKSPHSSCLFSLFFPVLYNFRPSHHLYKNNFSANWSQWHCLMPDILVIPNGSFFRRPLMSAILLPSKWFQFSLPSWTVHTLIHSLSAHEQGSYTPQCLRDVTSHCRWTRQRAYSLFAESTRLRLNNIAKTMQGFSGNWSRLGHCHFGNDKVITEPLC